MTKCKIAVFAVLLAFYIFLFLIMDCFRFPIRKDEIHFWRTSQQLFEDGFPSISRLRDYNDLSTPLPFVIFGGLDHLTHLGVFPGRLFNFLLSFSIACLICFSWERFTKSNLFSVCGLLLFPYFVFVSTHLYTDIIAAASVLMGIVLYRKERHLFSAIFWILGIASRQYMVAFPAAVVCWEIYRRPRKDQWTFSIRWVAPLISCFSLLGWYFFFGGFAPKTAMELQLISVSRWFPDHALYFFSCIGVYFVAVECVLFRRLPFNKVSWINVGLACVVSVLFLVKPPLQNVNAVILTMGLLDKTARLLQSDMLRVLAFWILAMGVCFRFNPVSFPALLILSNAVLMFKAHLAWDKYALPVLVVLWYLKSIPTSNEDQVPATHFEKNATIS